MKIFIISLSLFVILLHHGTMAVFFNALRKKDDPKASTVTQVVLSAYCNETFHVPLSAAAVSVVAVDDRTKRVPSCLTCPVTLHAEYGLVLLATVQSIGITQVSNGTCSPTRLDIYNGEDNFLLSDKDGLCGSVLPSTTYQSTSNSLIVQLETSCHRGHPVQVGTINIIVSTLQEEASCLGQFRCKHGPCLEMQAVCDGQHDCPDHSDEIGCAKIQNVVPHWIIVMLGISMLLFCIGIITCVVRCCCCDSVQSGTYINTKYGKARYTKV